LFSYLVTLTLVGLGAWAAGSLYYRYLQTPWTRDGQVRANIVDYGQPFEGIIQTVGWGIFVSDGSGSSTTALLPSVSRTIEVEFNQVLDAFRERLDQGDCPRPLPALQGPWPAWIGPSKRFRNRRPFGGEPPEAPSRLLDLVDRYRATAEAMEGCGRLLGSLQLQRYWGDYAL
jgi:hypothetical protein